MKFIDETKFTVVSGDGGSGASSFRREKFIPFGGPDGGNGGRGGHVYFVADQRLNTLTHLCAHRIYRAEDGENGSGDQCDGKAGEDLVLRVPIGTVIYDDLSGQILTDFVEEGQKYLIAEGGRGGLGNTYFKSSTNQAPRYAQKGTPGISLEIRLELKLLADIGLVGLPNAGKSTLISVISAARPKIADYPFTTLVPNLGVVKLDSETVVVADIPGLIENASEGKGLGIRFLKHLDRTQGLVHLVDCSWCLSPFEAFESYVIIRNELEKYSEELAGKKEIICLTKIDALTEEEILHYQQFFEEQLEKKVLPISAVSGKNISTLKQLLVRLKNEFQTEDSSK